MATSLVQVKQGAAGVVTATLYLTSGYLSGVSSRDDTIVVEFDYSDTATMLCQTTGSLDKSPCPLSMFSLRSCASVSCTGPAPAVDGSSTESMAASISICPSTNLSCGQNQDLITSDLFTFAGSGGGGSPGGANTPDLPAKTRTTTTAGAGKATTTTTGGNGVVTTTTKAGISTATIDATATVSTTASTPADNSSGSNTTLIGVGVGVGVAIIMAIGILCFFRRSVSKERMNRADFGPEGSKPMTAAPLPKNPAFNSSAPVKLDELERAERAAKEAPSARMPLFVPQQPVQQQQQPVYVAQYVPVPVVVAPQQPTQYPGYYDEQGQYHYFTQEQLAAQYAQAQVQQGLEVHPHPEAQQYQRQPRPPHQTDNITEFDPDIMDTSLIQIEQSKSGRVTATLYLNSLYLFTVGSKDDTISVDFTYSDTNTLLCSTTGSATRFKSCPSEMSSLISKSCVSVSCSGSAPIESGQSMQSVTADLTICPSNNLSCGRHSDTLVSDSVSLMGSGTVPITTTRLLPITSKIVPTTTEYVEPTTTTSEVDESPTATVTSTAIPQSGAGSSTNPAVIAICVAAGIIILIAIGLIVYCRRSIWKERMNRAGTDNDTFKVSELSNAPTPPPKTNAAFNNAAPVPLGVLERPLDVSDSPSPQPREPPVLLSQQGNYIPQAQVHPAGLVSRVSQPYHGQVEAHPSHLALSQTPQYPGYYDQFGNYYFYSSAELQQQQQQQQQQHSQYQQHQYTH